jgi:Xaa-Pro aminopeptidase
VSDQKPLASSTVLNTGSHDLPVTEKLAAFMMTGWADTENHGLAPLPVAPFAKARRERLSAQYPGKRIVIPAGTLKVRSNDTDYRFRPNTAFAYFTGYPGSEAVPDTVLVLEPAGKGHTAILYLRPRSPKTTEEFFRDRRYGELWVGRRLTLGEARALFDLEVRHIDELAGTLDQVKETFAVRGEDPEVDKHLPPVSDEEAAFIAFLSEMRLIKDDYEIEQLQAAVDATARGFEDMVRVIPEAMKEDRGERVIEGEFFGRARLEGNDIGYDSIIASGAHACVLHWIRNDGPVKDGDLILIDAGVEVESLYTADITRTLPVNGHFTEAQRRIYELVLAAQEAGIAAIRPGVNYREIHRACQRVLAKGLEELGFLPISAEESLDPEVGIHRRWTVHSSGHMLGIDVHDCARARSETYLDGPLQEGMVLTVEPGLYFQPDDLLVPEEYRGIGVRIEDDVVVTKDGVRNLSAHLPRHPDEIERWIATLQH